MFEFVEEAHHREWRSQSARIRKGVIFAVVLGVEFTR